MNIVKKIYCRVFQKAFHIAIPLLPYRNPEIIGKTTSIPKLLNKNGLSRPLLVTDKNIRTLGITKPLENAFAKNNLNLCVYDDVQPNPTTKDVSSALSVYRENNCDCIIAFGGGSSMDCAKAVGACIARPKMTLDKMAGILKVIKKTPVIIAVPTTAGTGSETTLASVIVDEETRHKYVINDFPLIPQYAVLDSSVIHTLPYSIAATTGMDALTHAVEAFIGNSTTNETRRYAVTAVKLIFKNIFSASSHESSEAEKAMLKASHLAGRAFTRSYVGYIHAVSHSLSGKYNLPHGLTNAVILPVVLEMYGEAVYPKLAVLARAVGINGNTKRELAEKFIEAVYDMNRRLGIPEKLEGICEDDIHELSVYADKEANPLYPVPVLWNAKELEKIYRVIKTNVKKG